jgi:hypothetical protein
MQGGRQNAEYQYQRRYQCCKALRPLFDCPREFEADGHYLELSRSERDMIDLVCQNFNDVIVVYNRANVFELGFVKEYEQIKGLLWCPGTG